MSPRAVESVRRKKDHDDHIAIVDKGGRVVSCGVGMHVTLHLLPTTGTEYCYLFARTISSSRTTRPCWQRVAVLANADCRQGGPKEEGRES